MHIRETVNLDIEKDADIIKWLNEQPNKSAAIRDALRAQYKRVGNVTNADLLAAIERLTSAGVAVRVAGADNGDEPIEAVMALEELGL